MPSTAHESVPCAPARPAASSSLHVPLTAELIGCGAGVGPLEDNLAAVGVELWFLNKSVSCNLVLLYCLLTSTSCAVRSISSVLGLVGNGKLR